MKRLIRILPLLVALAALVTGWCYWTAIADPVVREARVGLADWPAGAPPVRAVLISDIHVAGPDMPPARPAEAAAPFAGLRPRLGTFAVMGNHDHWREGPGRAPRARGPAGP